MTEETYNILFITVDSCSYESALHANLKALRLLSEPLLAESPANYTYPSHAAFFIGHLPRLKDGKLYLNKYETLWRPQYSNTMEKTHLINFVEPNILCYYKNQGYGVHGFGGVSFFDPQTPCNLLTQDFGSFSYFSKSKRLTRRDNTVFPLSHLEHIKAKLAGPQPFFAFINCPETHIPYDNPLMLDDPTYWDAVSKAYEHHYNKQIGDPSLPKISEDEITLLKQAQIKSLEWLDQRLMGLFEFVQEHSYNTVVIVCADHGEEFGENGRFGHNHNSPQVLDVPVWSGVLGKNKGQLLTTRL